MKKMIKKIKDKRTNNALNSLFTVISFEAIDFIDKLGCIEEFKSHLKENFLCSTVDNMKEINKSSKI